MLKVKSLLRVLFALRERAKENEGWDKILALNFPYDVRSKKDIPSFDDLPYEYRKDTYKGFLEDIDLLLEFENKQGFKSVLYEDNDTINYIKYTLFHQLNERLEYVTLCKMFKTTPEPFDVKEELSQFERMFYKVLMRTEQEIKIKNMLPKAKDKPTPEDTKEYNKAQKNYGDYCINTVKICAYYDLENTWNK